ncbi:ComF family protein, partial [Acidithiobacillus sp. MC6.1]|nr:ComF family protein [Acidithiobacillus sp. MC6.1]
MHRILPHLSRLHDAAGRFSHWLFPERCRACAAPGAPLCAGCFGDWPR